MTDNFMSPCAQLVDAEDPDFSESRLPRHSSSNLIPYTSRAGC